MVLCSMGVGVGDGTVPRRFTSPPPKPQGLWLLPRDLARRLGHHLAPSGFSRQELWVKRQERVGWESPLCPRAGRGG